MTDKKHELKDYFQQDRDYARGRGCTVSGFIKSGQLIPGDIILWLSKDRRIGEKPRMLIVSSVDHGSIKFIRFNQEVGQEEGAGGEVLLPVAVDYGGYGGLGDFYPYMLLGNIDINTLKKYMNIKPESVLPENIQDLIDNGDFGCRKDSVQKLIEAVWTTKKEK